MYNFYFYILLLTILSPISLYFFKIVLNELSIVETLFIINIFITIFLGIIYYFNKDKNKNLYDIFLNKPNIICLILIITTIYIINKFSKSIIVKNENITRFKPILTALSILVTTILGYFVFNEEITLRKCFSIFIITIGILIGI
jgi:drug/metabolite transporter (DMT)-like permease